MKHPNRRPRLGQILCVLMVACSVLSCRAQSEQEIVARWNDVHISLADFEDTYFHFWQATERPDSPALRQQVARQLIEHRLIANAGRQQDLQFLPAIQQRLQRDYQRFVRTTYLEETLEPLVEMPGDEEVKIALARTNKRYFVRQLFSLTPEGIDSLQQRLEQGEAFVDLARTTLPDPVMAQRGGMLGWVGWGDTDLPVEDALYEMTHGEISAPVESLMGWHIFRVDSVEQTVTFEEPDTKTFEDTRSKLYHRKMDMVAAKRIRDFVWDHELAIDMRVARQLWREIAPQLPRQANQLPMALEILSESPPAAASEQVVATVDGTPFYARQFYSALPNLPRGYLGPNLKQAIEIAIRDSLLAAEGERQGFGDHQNVLTQLQNAEDSYLYNEMMRRRIDSLKAEQPDLDRFYDRYRTRYISYTETEVWEILMANPDSARVLAQRIHAGLNFAEAAQTYSLRDSTRAAEGYLGFVRSDAGPIGARAAQMRTGALYGPVETSEGFSVIRTGVKVPVFFPLEAIEERVRQDAERMVHTTAYQNLLPAAYAPEQIIFDTAVLEKAFSDAR